MHIETEGTSFWEFKSRRERIHATKDERNLQTICISLEYVVWPVRNSTSPTTICFRCPSLRKSVLKERLIRSIPHNTTI